MFFSLLPVALRKGNVAYLSRLVGCRRRPPNSSRTNDTESLLMLRFTLHLCLYPQEQDNACRDRDTEPKAA